MVETTKSDTVAAIEAVRQELGRFQSQQLNAAVILRCAAVDADLAEALALKDRYSPWMRRILARDVEKLAQALGKVPSHHGGAINALPAGEFLDVLSDARCHATRVNSKKAEIEEAFVNKVSVNQCAQCRADIIAAEWSEHLSDYCIRNVWACEACGYQFEDMVYFSRQLTDAG